MLDEMLDSDVIFWVMGIIAGIGVFCKMITVFTLKRLVRSAGKMGKSNQKLMKLVKAKFEHAFMLSDRVDNVEVFVEKYLYEYRVFGVRLYQYQYFGKQSVWLVGILGLGGMLLHYGEAGLDDTMFHYGIVGGTIMIFMFLVRISSDDEYQMEVVKTYMIDYLENVCAPRYSKQQALRYQKMENVMKECEVVEEKNEQPINPEMKEIKPEQNEVLQGAFQEELQKELQEELQENRESEMQNTIHTETEDLKQEKRVPQEAILREILEEFLA